MSENSNPAQVGRRAGDTIDIVGEYQYRALTAGFVVQRFWHQLKIVEVERVAPPAASWDVLDVGCGSGVVANYLASRARMVHAVDANPRAIEFARAKFSRENLVFHLRLVDEMKFEPASFDAIYCLEFIEHLYREQAIELVRRFATLLKPAGIIYITTPNYHSAWPIIEKTMDLFRLAPAMTTHQHVWKPTVGKLRALALACGFDDFTVRRTCGIAPFVSVLGWRLAQKLDVLEARIGNPLGNLLVAVLRKG